MQKVNKLKAPEIFQERSCRICGCTDMDCRGCIQRTGQACHWIAPDLCSACADWQDLKIEMVDGFPLIVENGFLQIRRTFFGALAPGYRIKTIGVAGKNGKVTSSHRIDRWNPFITYEGKAVLPLPNCPPAECLIFRLPGDGVRDLKGKSVDAIFYVSYYNFGRSLMRNHYGRHQDSTQIFSSDFFTEDDIHIKGE